MGLFSKYLKISARGLDFFSVALGLSQGRRVPGGKFWALCPNDFAKNPNCWKMGLASWQSNEQPVMGVFKQTQRLS